jgi:predicted transcriptional regulator YheO
MQEQIRQQLLDSYLPIAKGIAATFGKRCEVVIHDLSMPKRSIRHIINAEVSGRKVGDGIRDLVLDVLRSPDFKDDMLANYEGVSPLGKKMKSTTVVIRDHERQVIGCLCINFDISPLENTKQMLDELLATHSPSAPADAEVEVKDREVLGILEYIIDKTITDVSGGISRTLSREEMIDIVRYLDRRGAFLIKGAVEWVATKLKISRFTVYSYIKEAKVESFNQE